MYLSGESPTRSALGLPAALTLTGALLVLPALAGEVQTFEVEQLDPGQAAEILAELLPEADVSLLPADLIEVRGNEEETSRALLFFRIFDRGPRYENQPLHLIPVEHLDVREASTLLRSELNIRALLINPETSALVVRDTPEQLDRAVELIRESEKAIQ
jgi:hypothetical protein